MWDQTPTCELIATIWPETAQNGSDANQKPQLPAASSAGSPKNPLMGLNGPNRRSGPPQDHLSQWMAAWLRSPHCDEQGGCD